jgi:hypothetical protein
MGLTNGQQRLFNERPISDLHGEVDSISYVCHPTSIVKKKINDKKPMVLVNVSNKHLPLMQKKKE